MNRVKLRFVAKKPVKHYFLFFEKITLSSNKKSSIKIENNLMKAIISRLQNSI